MNKENLSTKMLPGKEMAESVTKNEYFPLGGPCPTLAYPEK